MKKRLLSSAIIFCMVCAFCLPAAAVDSSINDEHSDYLHASSLDEIIAEMDITVPDNATVSLGSISLFKNSNADSTACMSAPDTINVPTIVVSVTNDDGTTNDTAYFSLIPDENGNLESGIDYASGSADTGVATLSYSPSVADHTVELNAAYASMTMPNGKAYKPSVSSVKITGASNMISNCSLYTLLTGQYLASSYSSYVDSWPRYELTKNIGWPTMGTTYSNNDYSYYNNSSYDYGGFGDKFIYIVRNGYGSYIVKCQFYYKSTMYTAVYGIYNYTSYTG